MRQTNAREGAAAILVSGRSQACALVSPTRHAMRARKSEVKGQQKRKCAEKQENLSVPHRHAPLEARFGFPGYTKRGHIAKRSGKAFCNSTPTTSSIQMVRRQAPRCALSGPSPPLRRTTNKSTARRAVDDRPFIGFSAMEGKRNKQISFVFEILLQDKARY